MTNLETAHLQIEALVRKYKNLSPRQRGDYNEAATRQGLVLPLFAALGWDTADTAEVSPETKVSKGWVDFSFRLGGIPRFFLETKKVAADLNDPQWARQVINYAWTKSVTWGVLSDFEGLKVFNAEWKEENPLRAQFIEFDVDAYLSDFERLWWLSRPETLAGRLDREAERVGRKARKQPVSQQLFDDLKQWRYDLFKTLRGHNPLYSAGQIDEAVLRILNRLIFIRAAEDRQVEELRLRPLLRELADQRKTAQLPARLGDLFREFNDIYDSDLFRGHFSEELTAESEPLARLIEGLYETRSGFIQYNFNAIDADVLGTVYEQYLGHVVADPQAAETEDKRRKRKSQGIYYTPTFVVKYIVQQTLGRLLEEQGYNPGRPPRVLDMACGSGSFLIEAFDSLDRYVARLRGQAAPGSAVDDFHDHARRMELLSSCVYGVDKDEQAVAVAKLNLSLKALQSRERLHMLDNVRVGDSLIGGEPAALEAFFGPDWAAQKPFDWWREFPAVMGQGGFDVIVGNPPYVRQETLGAAFKNYAAPTFETYAGTADLYVYFIERAMSLLKPGGILGFIVANKWLRASYGAPLRRWLKGQHLVEIIDFGDLPVFQTAITYPCILILRKAAPAPHFRAVQVKTLDFASLDAYVEESAYTVGQTALDDGGWSLAGGDAQALQEKIKAAGVPLGDYVDAKIYRGVLTGLNRAFVIDAPTRARLVAQDPRSAELIKPFLMGRDVKRYLKPEANRFLIFSRRGTDINQYPAVRDYLSDFRDRLTPRPPDWTGQQWQGRKPGSYQWFEIQDTVDYYHEFETPKLLFPDIAIRGNFTLDLEGRSYSANTTYIIPVSDKYLLGLLNSSLITHYYSRLSATYRGGYLRFIYQYVSKLPIRRIDFEVPADREMHDQMVALVEEMLQRQQELAAAERQKEDRRFALRRLIEEVDRAIDQLVYRLYDLTAAEINIIESEQPGR